MSNPLLLDANILIALCFPDHVHHRLATQWFSTSQPAFATCPITQGALVRFALRQPEVGSSQAQELLDGVTSIPNHLFWPDDVPLGEIPWRQVFGHRQVTDAYLVSLARHHGGKLATLDQALATVFKDAVLIGTNS